MMLAGRRGLVLGVSSANSIGYAIAQELHQQGAQVELTCRPARVPAMAPLAAALAAPLHALDAADDASFARAFAGDAPLDFLVHTLVDVPPRVLAGDLLDVGRDDFAHVLEVAAWSLIAACRHARPRLVRSPAPRVVALTSACSHRMTPHYHVAGIAKAALESAVLYLAMALGRDGVLVNAVGSSLIATDGATRTIGSGNAAATRAAQARRSATGRAIDAGDVAACVSYLCSPLARNLTGEVITIDGGFSRAYL